MQRAPPTAKVPALMDWTLTLEALASVMTTAQALDQERPEHPKIWHIKM